MADLTITVSDGTVTAALTIPAARVAATVAALSATAGDVSPPVNPARAVRSALALWIPTTRRLYRTHVAQLNARTSLDATLAAITADEAAP